MRKQFWSRRNSGFALIVILAFVVLLTIMVLAYFSYSAQQRQISNANSNHSTANIFAQGAVNTIISDLKQEIYLGSINSTYGTNQVSIPLASSNAAPTLVGTSSNLPNLLKRSASGLPFSPGRANVTSAVSTTNASQNGRSFSAARWNSSMLLPKANTNSTDLTPANFTAPDWVLVDRGGGNPTAWNPGLKWSNASTNTNSVVGRYAYAIYDEGGLLDVNVAGYPPGATNMATAYKNTLASADLTQVGLSTNVISAMVGWRNVASALPDGNFPNYTFSTAAQSGFFKNIEANTSGFLRTMSTNVVAGESDRMFISRQQFIQFANYLADSGLQSKASLQNALQYLGTSSRGLEQPSFAPNTSRPKIIGGSAPPVGNQVNSYLGNNDAVGGDDIINRSFLSVRVINGFTRWDGTQAVPNEPLIMKRFSLRRLGYLTFEGPSSTASVSTKNKLLAAGVTQATIDEGTPENIYKCFGLTWNPTGRTWQYNHGSATIMTLGQAAAANREPDFFEMLKGSINVGSLAKAGPNLHNNQGNYQYTVDTTLDYHVLQIGANIIDQSDFDSYPTVVQINSAAGWRNFRGVEDLPYFYRYHPMTVVTRLPVPLLSTSDTVRWYFVSSGSLATTTLNCAPGSVTDAGEAAYLLVPDVWNPHNASTTLSSSDSRPARFRLAVITQDPLGQTPAWNTGALSKVNGDWYDDIPLKASIPTPLAPLAESTTAFTFGDDGGKLYREPTLLYRNDAPLNSGITPDVNSTAGPYVDVNTNVSYFGVCVGKTPVSYTSSPDSAKYYGVTSSGTMAPNTTCIFQGSYLEPNQAVQVGGFAQYTFRLQYQAADGTWVTYDEKYPDFHGLYRPNLIVNKANYANGKWKNPYSSGQMNDCSTGYDPRTARFGIGTATSLDKAATSPKTAFLEPGAASNYQSGSDSGNQAFADSRATIMVTQRPIADRGNQVNYSTPGMTSDPGKNAQIRFFGGVGYSASNGQNTSPTCYDGLWSQNDSSIKMPARDNTTQVQFFYEDPDGIGRRGMAAYADKTLLSNASVVGMPHATANTYLANSYGVGTPTAQSQSRPTILNRPFRNVAELGYAFRGVLWKQIDFFTPESGDTALLDTFCINDAPVGAMVAGKVNLNTRQPNVLKAVLAGAYREEFAILPGTLPSGVLKTPLDATEAANVANKLVSITSDTNSAWRGPLSNVGQLVGRYVPNAGSVGTATDALVFTEPVTGVSYTYSGLSAALDATVLTNSTASVIQRLREASIRPLAAAGQVRVWNLMIDVVAQVGRYGPGAGALDQFTVEGEQRFWVHVAIDRMTGKVIDQQWEQVTE